VNTKRAPEVLTALVSLIGLLSSVSVFASDWPEWRSNGLDGVVTESGFPKQWSADENILWEVDLPAPGNSSPVVFGDRIFVTCATEDGAERGLLAFNRENGDLLWHRSISYKEDDPTHATNPWCAATPATDGEYVYVWNGSAGATAYDYEGNQIWHRDLGKFFHMWGHASSPRIYKDTVVFFGSPGPRVLLTALDKESGETVWERSFEELTSPPQELYGSFVTPLLWQNGDRDELLIPLPGYLASFDPDTGEEWWRCDGLGALIYSDAMLNETMLFAFSGFKGAAIAMRKPGADETGNLTDTHRIWINEKVMQRVGTGVIVGDRYYMCGRKGDLHAGDIHTGEILWTHKLREQAWSSINHVGDELWLTDQSSVTHVFEPADEFNPIRQNSMHERERTNSTLVFSEDQIFLRTHDRLYSIFFGSQ
jgi:outer membrane protein assembly factor BamB